MGQTLRYLVSILTGYSQQVTKPVRLGLEENLRQFILLVVVNGFVGAMVGLERTILPLMAEQDFGMASRSAILSFIATFGLTKAATNFVAGQLGDRIGRRNTLIIGWLFALPVPFLVIWAPSWSWIIGANVLLGINQGLAWSTTVIMKIDLVGPGRRGFAMGLNEAAGYLAVALAALASGLVAEAFGLRPEPFYLGIAFSTIGLALTVLFVKDTLGHVGVEAAQEEGTAAAPSARTVFADVSIRDPALSSVSQAGLVNNLNDGMAWGVFPLLFAAGGLGLAEIGLLTFMYPATWGLAQLWTGGLSDRVGRKPLIVAGMLLQALALVAIGSLTGFAAWLTASLALGFGTALVYPTLLAAIGDVAGPLWRGSAVGVYRLWRDTGYAVGALIAGFVADRLGLEAAILVVAALTLLSGLQVLWRMPETLPGELRH
jgi:MFS family permease